MPTPRPLASLTQPTGWQTRYTVALMCMAATIPGIVAVTVTGYILETTGSWDLVWQTTAGVTIAGGLFYLIFASGEKQFD